MSPELLPHSVEICDVGPRDGFQFESKPIPTELKLDVIRGLIAAGVPRIQITSFVHRAKVPQMADAENLITLLLKDPEQTGSTVFSGLCLNMKGIQRAAESGLRHVDISLATNEQHSTDNANMTVEEGVQQAEEMITQANQLGLQAQLGLQTVFGYKEPGDTSLEFIIKLSKLFSKMPIESLSLADSTGLANPAMMRITLDAVSEVVGDVPIVLHLHDTRGLGLANATAALEMGVRRFDTSFGGLGGCPFIPGATGNIPTEEVVYLCEGLGFNTGIDTASVARQSRRIAEFLGRSLSGKLYKLF